jgi:hypothetical protein
VRFARIGGRYKVVLTLQGSLAIRPSGIFSLMMQYFVINPISLPFFVSLRESFVLFATRFCFSLVASISIQLQSMVNSVI